MARHFDVNTLIDYLHGALSKKDDAQVFDHIATCRPCRAVHDEEIALGEALRAAARGTELEFPSLLDVRVKKVNSFNDTNGIFTSQTAEFEYDSGQAEFDESARIRALIGPDGRSLPAANAARQRLITAVSSANIKLLTILKQKPDLVWQLSSRRFEELVAEILSNWGYEVMLTPPSKDGGVDIYALSHAHLGRFLYLIECKRYIPPHKVGVETVRSLYGIVQTKRATAGAIVTTSFFTAGAEAFQKEVPYQMKIHDFLELKRWIADSISDDPTSDNRFVDERPGGEHGAGG
jgi:Restriction endonuclease/Putative zinc-finger